MTSRNATTLGTIWFDEMPSPIGRLRLVADATGLRQIHFEHPRHPLEIDASWVQDPARLAFARTQLLEYFSGKRRAFDVPLHPLGTSFQCDVWTALGTIAYGETASYGYIARRIGNPKAVRAVGAANGRNPLPIIVPCHRVIGSNGALTGFGGG
ncbi:MAG: methylated-DNA--[protein]-cysteine S-methyltransferase, partial [Lysobacteraceae bacterium]